MEPQEQLNRAEAQELLEWMITQDPTEPMEPIRIPFRFLPEEIQGELRNLPQGSQDPVAIKLCCQCGMMAVLFHDLVVWTGAPAGHGVSSTVTHRTCMPGHPREPQRRNLRPVRGNPNPLH